MYRPTVVFDFDGVIHSYISGWQRADVILDPPVDGISQSLKEIQEAGYEIVIVSSRCATAKGTQAINDWLVVHELYQYIDRICKEKPPAVVYVDDRAICFDGDASSLLQKIKAFKPWNFR